MESWMKIQFIPFWNILRPMVKHTRQSFYNLDAILSVGYRVNSKNATVFRLWANKVLKEYLLRGYSVNQRLIYMESRMDNRFMEYDKRLNQLSDKVDFFVRTSVPPVEGIFFNGQIFDAHVFASGLVKSARKRLVLIDNYVSGNAIRLDGCSGDYPILYVKFDSEAMKPRTYRNNPDNPGQAVSSHFFSAGQSSHTSSPPQEEQGFAHGDGLTWPEFRALHPELSTHEALKRLRAMKRDQNPNAMGGMHM